MANLKEENKWEEGIYQLEVTDPVVGGIDGISNKQAKQLANRTKFLKESIDTLNDGKLGKKETAVDSQKLDGKTADAFAQLDKENTFTKNLTIGSEGVIHANNNDSHFLIEAKNKGKAIGLGTPKPDGSSIWHYFTHEGFRTEASVNAGILKIKGVNTDEIYLKKDEASDGTPIGAYLAWSSESKIPAGYLLCDGRSLKKSEYKELFAVIGYTYGGSGENFNIPKFNDGRFFRSIGGNAAALGTTQGNAIDVNSLQLNSYTGDNGGTRYTYGTGSTADYRAVAFTYSNTGADFGYRSSAGKENAAIFSSTKKANENRPYNSSMVVLIKAKDVKEPSENEVDKSIYATETKAGIIKIKNSITGQQEDVAVSEKAVANIASIGVNQTWQDMTSQRQMNVIYINTTNRPIQVYISATAPGINDYASANIEVGGVIISSSNTAAAAGRYASIMSVSAIVPPNSSYKATGSTNFKWLELR